MVGDREHWNKSDLYQMLNPIHGSRWGIVVVIGIKDLLSKMGSARAVAPGRPMHVTVPARCHSLALAAP
jgi:hypothetical protein